jgi:hypothetical protein
MGEKQEFRKYFFTKRHVKFPVQISQGSGHLLNRNANKLVLDGRFVF